MKTIHQSAIFRAMEAESFYPHTVDAIEQRETHISKVFLAGAFVYKIKKPVDLGFLDFTTLEKRRRYCRRELELNRRLTENVYLDVVPITHDGDVYRLSGPGTPVEYAVKMRRLPEAASMAQMLRNERIEPARLSALGRVLSAFYKKAKTGGDIDAPGSWQTVWKNCEENFTQMAPYAGNLIDARMMNIIRAATRSFMLRQRSLFYRRVETGKIRDCHGDLRTEHIYFTDDGIQIIDCIEFNDRFRYSDISSDLAFLAMDIDFPGYPEAAEPLLSAYAADAEDDEVFTLIAFYKCYRAMVRAKVNCFRFDGGFSDSRERETLLGETRRYMALAYRYALEYTRPTIWVVCGMIASGKSTLSRLLAEKFDVRVLRSDVIRKALFGIRADRSMETSFGRGIYSGHATSLTYGKLLRLAQEEIEEGASVILDASFGDPHWRREVMRLAEDMDANVIFIECTAPDATLEERLKKRGEEASVSDARLEHFVQFRDRYAPLNEVPVHMHTRVDTDLPPAETMAKILTSDYFLLSEQAASVIKKSSGRS